MQERSKQYDWFKGPQNSKDNRDWKAGAKTTWKFTKIFLYFSLFFFSMWGCVQVFTHKTSTNTSQGVTFANGDSNLSPQENTFQVTSTTDKAGDIYLEYKTESSFEAVNEGHGKDIIADVNAYLKSVGVSSPTKARKGGNYAIKLKDTNGKYITTDFNKDRDGIVYGENGQPLVYTTAKTNNKYDQDTPLTKRQYSFRIFTLDKDNKIDKSKTILYIIPRTGIKNIDMGALRINFALFENLANYKVNETNSYYSLLTKTASEIQNTTPPKDKNGIADFAAKINSYNTRVSQLLAHIGVPSVNSKNANHGIINYRSTPIGFNHKSNWIPITTWGKAWSPDGGMGPFYGLFVFPISYITNAMIDAMPIMAGWESFITIALVVVIISLFMFGINWKNTFQQTRMQELSAKKAIIDAKYASYKGNKQMEQRQRQEVSELYKKEGISPLASLGGVFITMPFFLAMWRVIGSIDHIKGTTWIGIRFSATSWRELFGHISQWSGGWVYFPLMVLAAGLQIVSQMLPQFLTRRRDRNRINVQQKQAMKKGNKTQRIMMFVFAFMALIFSAGLQVYFIVRSLWRIGEVLLTHRLLIYNRKRRIAKGIK